MRAWKTYFNAVEDGFKWQLDQFWLFNIWKIVKKYDQIHELVFGNQGQIIKLLIHKSR